MLICRNCGEVLTDNFFEDEYEVIEGVYAHPASDRCPCCGDDDLVEAEKCSGCGDWHEPDEIYGGLCWSCVEAAMEADRFFRWAVDGASEDKYSSFEDFMFTQIFHIAPSECPTASSYDLRCALEDVYNSLDEDELIKKACEYLKKINDVENFVEFYLDERKKVR